jgi:hypothetical protein
MDQKSHFKTVEVQLVCLCCSFNCSPYENRTHVAGMKTRIPITTRRTDHFNLVLQRYVFYLILTNLFLIFFSSFLTKSDLKLVLTNLTFDDSEVPGELPNH